MRHILVTGANKGIGRAIAREILRGHEDTFVFVGSRDAGRGQEAVEALAAEEPAWAKRCELVPLDVSSDDSVRAAATQIEKRLGGGSLYGVVNNAGIGLGSGDLEAIFEVNTRGVKRVCDALIPVLDSERGRIVNITSASGPNFVSGCSSERQSFFRRRDVEWSEIETLMEEGISIAKGNGDFASQGLGGGNAYGFSKACGNSLTMLLARQHSGLRINACTPGFIETDMTRPYAEAQGRSPEEMGMKSPAEGARSALFLLFDEPEGNGNYYGSDAKRSPLDRYRSPGDPEYRGD